MTWTRAVLTLLCLDTLTTVRKTASVAEATYLVFLPFCIRTKTIPKNRYYSFAFALEQQSSIRIIVALLRYGTITTSKNGKRPHITDIG